MDKREFLFNFLGKETVSPTAKRAGDSIEDLGDRMTETQRDAARLDEQIAEVESSLRDLAAQYARTGDDQFVKQIRAQERELRKLSKVRMHLPKFEPPPPPEPEEVRRWGVMFAARVGPVLVQALPSALTAGGGVGAAIGAPMVAGLAAWLGSAATGAIIGGSAAGAVAAGIGIASRDSRVQEATASLSASIGERLEDAAEPFVPATLRAIDTVKRGFSELDDDLDDIFGDSAAYVQPLTDGVMGFVKAAVPGFRDVVRAAGPVIQVFANQLPELGGEVADTLSGLAEHGESAARALAIVFEVAGAGIKIVGQGLELASRGFQAMDLIGAAWRGPQALGERTTAYAIAASEAENETTEWDEALKKLDDSAAGAVVELRSLHDAVSDIVDKNLNLVEANLRVAEAVDAAKESVDGKRRVTRDEESALVDLARRLNDATTALDDQGVSAIQSAEAHESNRKKLIAAAVQAGHTREAAERLATQWLKVPRNVSTTVNAKTSAANSALRAVRNTLDALDGRVANASVYISAYNKNAGPGDRRAAGGPVRANQAYIVGEHREEVFVPDVAGRIIPSVEEFNRSNGYAADAAQGAAGGAVVLRHEITLRWPDGTVAGQIVADGIGTRAALSALQGALRTTPGVRLRGV